MMMITLLMTYANIPTQLVWTEQAILSRMDTPPDDYLILDCGDT